MFRLCLLIGIFSFLLYINTLKHGFVLDDNSIIKENVMTQKGSSALGEIFSNAYRAGYNTDNNLYRPLSKAMFAVEWSMSPDNPKIHHFINILIYAFVCMLLFFVLKRITNINTHLLLLGVLLFAAHPIHTEVVANIKSRDELLAMLFLLLSIHFITNYIKNNKILTLILSLACFFLGLLSKESAIVFVGIVPLVLYFFSEIQPQKILINSLVFAGVAVFYLLIHKSVIGSIGLDNIHVIDNSLAATQSFAEQRMTAILIMGKYLLLLLFPHPLSSDYSYNTIPNVTSLANIGFLLSFVLHIFLLVWALRNLKSKNILSFCILFYLISMAITSNIFMLIGTNMAERLLFFPSLGFCLAVVILLSKLFKTDPTEENTFSIMMKGKAKNIVVVCGVAALLFSFKTIDRNKDWKSNITLFTKDAETVPNSAHMLMYTTDYMMNKDTLKAIPEASKKEYLLKAQRTINKALNIYYLFPDGHFLSGRIWYDLGNYDSAKAHYDYASSLNPGKPIYHNNAGTCYFALGQYEQAAERFKKAEELSPDFADHPFNLGSAYGALGESYRVKGDRENANKLFMMAIGKFQRAIQLDPKYKSAYQFMGASYVNMGDTANGKLYLDRAAAMPERP